MVSVCGHKDKTHDGNYKNKIPKNRYLVQRNIDIR
jgi:hypothetical protein